MEEINSKALQENEKLDLPLNAFLPNFDDEEIKEFLKKLIKTLNIIKIPLEWLEDSLISLLLDL